jgi:hypothetical protein
VKQEAGSVSLFQKRPAPAAAAAQVLALSDDSSDDSSSEEADQSGSVSVISAVEAPPASSPRPPCAPEVQNMMQKYVTTVEDFVADNKKELDTLNTYFEALKELRQKLTQEKAVQCEQLNNVYDEAVKARAPKRFVDLVKRIVDESKTLSDLKDRLNAAEWAQHEKRLMETLDAVPLPLPAALVAVPESGGRKRRREVDAEGVEVVGVRPKVYNVTPDNVIDLTIETIEIEPAGQKPKQATKAAAQGSKPTSKKRKPTVQEQRAKAKKTEELKAAKLKRDSKLADLEVKYATDRQTVTNKLEQIQKEISELEQPEKQELEEAQDELVELTQKNDRLKIREQNVKIQQLKAQLKKKLQSLTNIKDEQDALLKSLSARLEYEREKIKKEYVDLTVSGGARHRKRQAKRAQKKLKKALEYCGCRSNAYYQCLLKKVMRDRQRHQDLIKELHYHAIKLMGGGAPMTQMLNQMAHDQKIYGARRTQLDAKQWSDLAAKVKGGGCGYMLRAGGCCVTGCQ